MAHCTCHWTWDCVVGKSQGRECLVFGEPKGIVVTLEDAALMFNRMAAENRGLRADLKRVKDQLWEHGISD